MDEFRRLIEELNQIIGFQGKVEPNFYGLAEGAIELVGEHYNFAISNDYILGYPKHMVSGQTAKLIPLLFRQIRIDRGHSAADGPESLLRMVLQRKTAIRVEEMNMFGIRPEEGYLPLVVSARKLTGSWYELFRSYFTQHVLGVTMEGFYHALIPMKHLALEANVKLDLEDLGRGFAELLEEEGMNSIHVAFAEPVYSLMDWYQAFNTAKITIYAGTKFYPKMPVYFSWKMSLENMLSILPDEEVERYQRGILGVEWMNKFDPEIYRTTKVLLQENFNISETARKLFIHRNTLLYRLDRVKDETGKDLRISVDAFEVYIALLLLKKNWEQNDQKH
jgi:hypothetical protein